ncbi:MAG: DUF2062 domain-containing protein, partial [Bacteroidales bacterium]|nr:DUF2062 domain-containing protein [Bacteroidales bacterium]
GDFCGAYALLWLSVCAGGLPRPSARLNKLGAGGFSAISIPPAIPFIMYGSYWTGCTLLGRTCSLGIDGVTLSGMAGMLAEYTLGGFVFAAAGSSLCAAICICLMTIFRRR